MLYNCVGLKFRHKLIFTRDDEVFNYGRLRVRDGFEGLTRTLHLKLLVWMQLMFLPFSALHLLGLVYIMQHLLSCICLWLVGLWGGLGDCLSQWSFLELLTACALRIGDFLCGNLALPRRSFYKKSWIEATNFLMI